LALHARQGARLILPARQIEPALDGITIQLALTSRSRRFLPNLAAAEGVG
jgi:hypothetical protein